MFINKVEKHIIKINNPYYKMLDDFCFKSKNLYNFANYQIRQEYIKNKKYIGFYEMDKLLKQENMDFDYRNMPSAVTAQQTLKLLDKNWASFFNALKDWKKNPEKYTGRPKIPKYLHKEKGRFMICLTISGCKLKKDIINFPKTFNGFQIKTKVNNLQQVRILPRKNYFVIEVVYRKEISELKENNNKYFSIDVGLDNLLTIVNNFGDKPMIINGKGLKSINQYYNKKLSHYKEIAKRMNDLNTTYRLDKLSFKRNNKVEDFIHKVSRLVVDLAEAQDVCKIIIGNNKDWKRESKMSKKVNQKFISIPHQELINKIIYKAKEKGIEVILTEESYTSGTSFLDNEEPNKKYYDKSRRKYRGLFISNNGIKINSDVNGAYQIMKKVFPNVYANGIEGMELYPIVVNII